ncbi:TPA: glycosidase [Candidatus Bathyarchaeota archaeon]|nr:glycosidase [Candidatus Bathyarchaeota archaeon]HIJ08253.1 glycosidase [Candidatus Bathyarchaeota archaeon]
MKRFQGNPILEPIGSHRWESRRVFNAGIIANNSQVHILYRAMGQDGVSRIGYANSSDGYHIDERLPKPVLEPAGEVEVDGVEDPRLTLLDDKLLMAYTAFGKYANHQVYQIALTSIDIRDFLRKEWNWNERHLVFPGLHNKDAVIFPRKLDGKYLLFHRFEPDACLASSEDLRRWYDLRFVFGPRERGWDSWKVGAGGPPIELNEGWLFIYHGVSIDRVYSLGVALLDKHNPEKVIFRPENPILSPEEDYERFGKVPNVVFSCGQILKDDKVLVYYGGADNVLCVATFDLSELLPRK